MLFGYFREREKGRIAMNVDKPKISVCIPVYNGERYITQTINSVLSQTFEEFELIIVDNCSTDKTLSLVNEFDDKRIRIVENPENIGMVGNWNACLKHANCDWVLLLCADDLIEKDCLEKKYELAISDSDISFVFSASSVINANGKKMFSRKPFSKDNVFSGGSLAKRSFVKHNFFGEPSNILYNRNIAKKLGGYSNKVIYSPDWEFCIRLASNGKVGYVNSVLTYYRVSDTMATVDLIKNKNFIKRDEEILIKEIKEKSGINITFLEVLIHNFSLKLRLLERGIFLWIVNHLLDYK